MILLNHFFYYIREIGNLTLVGIIVSNPKLHFTFVFFQNTETATNAFQHHHNTRAAENFFNVPESITLLNIVKPERLQNNPLPSTTEDENQQNNSETVIK